MNVNEINECKGVLKESINELLIAFTKKNSDEGTDEEIQDRIDNWVKVRDQFIDDLEDLAIQVALDLDNN
jgi:hypothetical protein